MHAGELVRAPAGAAAAVSPPHPRSHTPRRSAHVGVLAPAPPPLIANESESFGAMVSWSRASTIEASALFQLATVPIDQSQRVVLPARRTKEWGRGQKQGGTSLHLSSCAGCCTDPCRASAACASPSATAGPRRSLPCLSHLPGRGDAAVAGAVRPRLAPNITLPL